MNRRTLAALPVLSLIFGCHGSEGLAPIDRREALSRVNDNLAEIDRPLQYTALLSFSFRDEDGKMHRYLGQESSLLFSPPGNLRVDVRSPLGAVAQFGANAERYWLWVDPELHKLWWGTWNNAAAAVTRRLPVPPNELFDALMLRPLPEMLEGDVLPVLRVVGDDQRLIYVRLGPDRQPSSYREIRLDPKPPYQPREIIDRRPDGAIVMHAQLDDYRELWTDGAITPRRFVVAWPEREAELRMDVLRARPRPDLPEDVFSFPDGWEGQIECIDVAGIRPGAGAE